MPYKFVYGAQMIHKWSLRHGEAARIDNHRIRFNHVGYGNLEPTFANLEAAPGEQAWGVLVEFPDHLWEEICRNEPSYDQIEVTAITPSGNTINCQAFTLKANRIGTEKQPSARYAKMLYLGAKKHKFPQEVIDRYKLLFKQGNAMTLWMGPLRQPFFSVMKTLITRKIKKANKAKK